MVNGTHSNVTLAIIYFLIKAAVALNKKLYIYTETEVFIPSRQKALEQLLEVVKSTQSPDVSSLSSSSSSPARSKSSKGTNSPSNSTPSPSSKKANYRPDISVYDVRPQEMKDGKLKSIKPPLMVFEVTSDNRVNDLTKKWTNYRRANIPEYIIVDRDQIHEESTKYSPSVIVGKLGKSWSLAPSGDPKVSPKSNRNISHHSEHQMYPRQVYKVDDPRVVDCSFIKMTAREMLTPVPLMECIMKDIEEAKKREESIKKERDVYKKNQDIYKEERDVYKEERDVYKEERDVYKEKLNVYEEKLNVYEEQQDVYKKKIDMYEKNQDVYKEERDTYKRERDELLKKLKASEAKPNEPLVNKSTANGQFSPRKRERRNSADSYNSGSSVAAKSSNGSVKGSKRA